MSQPPDDGYSRIPNVIFDEWMPHLSGAELAVVLFIARKTIGWNKPHDRISLSQMQEGTGLARSTVAAACASLHKRGAVEVGKRNGTQAAVYRLDLSWTPAECTENQHSECTENATSTKIGLVGKSVQSIPKIGTVSVPKIGPTKDTAKDTKREEPPDAKKHPAPEGQQAEEKQTQAVKRTPRYVRDNPPTIEEVTAYFSVLLRPDLAEGWRDHFAANGWKVSGKSPMEDWRASCRTWKRFDKKNGGPESTIDTPGVAEKPPPKFYDPASNPRVQALAHAPPMKPAAPNRYARPEQKDRAA